MKIGIVGLGIVGQAVKFAFQKAGHHVLHYDIKDNTKMTDVLNTDIVYICVPTKSNKDGTCDTSIVEDSVRRLVQTHSYSGIITIKSTVVPGTTQKLQAEHPDAKICFVPEFLRERCAIADFTDNHDVCVIGTESEHIFNVIKACHGRYPAVSVQLSPTEAEISKYFNNAYNATLITFANAFYELCQSMGADYGAVKSAMTLRDHIYDRYLECNETFRGFSGACLPKDTLAIASLIKQNGLNIGLFEAVLNDNKNYTQTAIQETET